MDMWGVLEKNAHQRRGRIEWREVQASTWPASEALLECVERR